MNEHFGGKYAEITTLASADYLYVARLISDDTGKVLYERVLDMVIERKAVQDACQCLIADSKKHKPLSFFEAQMYKMQQSGVSRKIFLMEGERASGLLIQRVLFRALKPLLLPCARRRAQDEEHVFGLQGAEREGHQDETRQDVAYTAGKRGVQGRGASVHKIALGFHKVADPPTQCVPGVIRSQAAAYEDEGAVEEPHQRTDEGSNLSRVFAPAINPRDWRCESNEGASCLSCPLF